MGSFDGALRSAATRVGLSTEAYLARIADGEKWCTACKAWHALERFGFDATRSGGRAAACLDSTRNRKRKPYTRRLPSNGARVDPRAGDKLQARRSVNYLVEKHRIVHPNVLPCTDCGHQWRPGARRHEYDHAKGYEPEHHLYVEPVCTRCHAARERKRKNDKNCNRLG